MQRFFEYSTEVEQAIKQKKPVLALESAYITHGLPAPENLQTALTLEQTVRNYDVTPATIAILHGKIKIGLEKQELETLVQDKSIAKVSTRELPIVLAQGLNAGTTVAASLFCADSAGIKTLATGGIGGVHRGDAQDISADLIELARTSIAIVCSGAKAILDLPKTIEFLETFSVPVIGYKTDYFPAFYTVESNCPLHARVDNVPALAKLLKIHWQLGMPSSVVVANPIPKENEIPIEEIEPVIVEALRLAAEKNITGKELTPFLLTELLHATAGKSLQANIKLLQNNVKLGAMLAHALVHI